MISHGLTNLRDALVTIIYNAEITNIDKNQIDNHEVQVNNRSLVKNQI